MGIRTIDEYIGKYDPGVGIKVDKVIIVGKSFSKHAKSLAGRLGYELHTLSTLESISHKDFTREPDSDKRCWLGGGQKVTLVLGLLDGRLLKWDFARGVLISKKSRKKFDSPVILAQRILYSHLATAVNRYYEENAGKQIHFVAEMPLGNMIYRRKRYKDHAVKTLFFDFGKRMMFPDFPICQELTYETPQGVSKKLKRVKPDDGNSDISITLFEDPLKGIHLDGVDKEVLKVIFRLDFDTEWSRISNSPAKI